MSTGSRHTGWQFPCRDHYHLRLLWFEFPHVHTSHVGSALMCGGLPMSPGTRDTGLQFAEGITIIRDCFDVSIPHVHMSHVDSAFM